jgi:hypothetical protein
VLPAGQDGQQLALTVESPLSVGQFVGKLCSYNAPPDQPYDQWEEDGGSLVFDREILDEHSLGAPAVDLDLEANQPGYHDYRAACQAPVLAVRESPVWTHP